MSGFRIWGRTGHASLAGRKWHHFHKRILFDAHQRHFPMFVYKSVRLKKINRFLYKGLEVENHFSFP